MDRNASALLLRATFSLRAFTSLDRMLFLRSCPHFPDLQVALTSFALLSKAFLSCLPQSSSSEPWVERKAEAVLSIGC